MSPGQPVAPAITNERGKALYEYWVSRRGSAIVPPRAAIDPVDIFELLPRLHLLDLRADGRFVWRLVGTELSAFLGRNLTGEIVDPAGPPRLDERFPAIYQAITSQPCGAVIRCLGQKRSGCVVSVETIALPLLDEAGRATKILAHSEPLDLDRLRIRHCCQFIDLRIERIDVFDIGAGLPPGEATCALLDQVDGDQ